MKVVMNVRDIISYLMMCNPEYAVVVDDRYGSNTVRDIKINHDDKEVVIIKWEIKLNFCIKKLSKVW